MAQIIEMPTTPNFVKSEFRLKRFIGQTTSAYTAKQRTQEYDAVFWEASVALPPMRRDLAVNWQSFLLNLNGTTNTFKFADPDALVKRGTYTGAQFKAEARVNETSITLSFTASTNTITGGSAFTGNLKVGDHIVVTGSSKAANNGTHKIVTIPNTTSVTVTPVQFESLVDESNKAGCTVRVNTKGARGLTLRSTANGHAGTILKGDYLGISSDTSDAPTTYKPLQYVIATEDAVETNNGGSALNQYAIKTEPKLRAALAANSRVYVTPAKGLFRLVMNDVSWSADNISNYGIAFDCVEVIQ